MNGKRKGEKLFGFTTQKQEEKRFINQEIVNRHDMTAHIVPISCFSWVLTVMPSQSSSQALWQWLSEY